MEAGFTRFRPVLMTALAMIIGMAPMALGLGEGGEQNAPLGRAVIGGLIFATFATLLFVPVVFSLAHGKAGARRPSPARAANWEKPMRSSPEALNHRPQRWLKPAGLAGLGLAAVVVLLGLASRGLAEPAAQGARLGGRRSHGSSDRAQRATARARPSRCRARWRRTTTR